MANNLKKMNGKKTLETSGVQPPNQKKHSTVRTSCRLTVEEEEDIKKK